MGSKTIHIILIPIMCCVHNYISSDGCLIVWDQRMAGELWRSYERFAYFLLHLHTVKCLKEIFFGDRLGL